jgi:hypothetical protein
MNDYDEFMATRTGELVYEMCRRAFIAGLARGLNSAAAPRFEEWMVAEFRVQDPPPEPTE